ncbi:MAG: hypothetical protein KAT39_11065 [Alphaproteobacteria bacterium]|nr:hypothetical protein [Alphaproteobacteria bacterium]
MEPAIGILPPPRRCRILKHKIPRVDVVPGTVESRPEPETFAGAAADPGCVKTIFGRSKRNIRLFTEFLQLIKSMA